MAKKFRQSQPYKVLKDGFILTEMRSDDTLGVLETLTTRSYTMKATPRKRGTNTITHVVKALKLKGNTLALTEVKKKIYTGVKTGPEYAKVRAKIQNTPMKRPRR